MFLKANTRWDGVIDTAGMGLGHNESNPPAEAIIACVSNVSLL